ncbi:MAG: hypothetical protein HRU05_18095 [Oceanospirillaceae bacterium]|nr:hypothetical protein [Oceanospirillaceae bacterium]
MSYINAELRKDNVSAEVVERIITAVTGIKLNFLGAFVSEQVKTVPAIIVDTQEYYRKAPLRTTAVSINIERSLIASGNSW